ncbi:MAG TPA: hypothetical protein VLM19_05015, partial [Nitrospiraceae bacterium]|nr:hypothetical protein [Nitrospiraceae bacterium]
SFERAAVSNMPAAALGCGLVSLRQQHRYPIIPVVSVETLLIVRAKLERYAEETRAGDFF